MKELLKKLERDYPHIVFLKGAQFRWSPKTNEVVYSLEGKSTSPAAWSLLHEVGHALLGHQRYTSDFELVEMEAAAWQKAQEVGKIYNIVIDADHVQDCLDSYRDWLHQRSACPQCEARSLQQENGEYRCFNCSTEWHVSTSRFCRPYRMTTKA